MATIYDHPIYYDILFGWNRGKEARFYDEAFRAHGVPESGRLLEIGCGTGHIAIRLVKMGWTLTGLDISPDMLEFLQQTAHSSGLEVDAVCSDMAKFALPVTFHGAYCPLSTFSVLHDDELVQSHLNSMAAVLLPGACYILDISLRGQEPSDAAEQDDGDHWTARRGSIEVVATYPQRVIVTDQSLEAPFELEWGEDLRAYTTDTFERAISYSVAFSFERCYPEIGKDRDGISIFDIGTAVRNPVPGRAMVVLNRV